MPTPQNGQTHSNNSSWQQPTNCFSVIHDFVGLTLKGLKTCYLKKNLFKLFPCSSWNYWFFIGFYQYLINESPKGILEIVLQEQIKWLVSIWNATLDWNALKYSSKFMVLCSKFMATANWWLIYVTEIKIVKGQYF